MICVDLAYFVRRRIGHKRKVEGEYNARRCRVHRCIGILTIGIKGVYYESYECVLDVPRRHSVQTVCPSTVT